MALFSSARRVASFARLKPDKVLTARVMLEVGKARSERSRMTFICRLRAREVHIVDILACSAGFADRQRGELRASRH